LACASFTTQVIGGSALWVGSMDPLADREPLERLDNREYFGSVFRSALTLLQVVTSSQWADLARRVTRVYPSLGLFFVALSFVTAFGLVNCMVSNVVSQAIDAARLSQESTAEVAREARRHIGEQVHSILRSVDLDGNGILSGHELDRAFARTSLRAVLRGLSVPELQGDAMVRLFDRDGTGKVTKEELIEGFIRMDDDITTKDYVRLSMWAKSCLMRTKRLGDRVGLLSDKCHTLRVTLEKAIEAMEYFKETREATNLRFNAIQAIRKAPPGEAPKLRGWKPPPEPKYPSEDEAAMFLGFATRLIGVGPLASQPSSHSRLRDGGRRGELPPAPPPLQIAKQIAQEEMAPTRVDRYYPVRDPDKYFMPAPSPSLRTLKELIE